MLLMICISILIQFVFSFNSIQFCACLALPRLHIRLWLTSAMMVAAEVITVAVAAVAVVLAHPFQYGAYAVTADRVPHTRHEHVPLHPEVSFADAKWSAVRERVRKDCQSNPVKWPSYRCQ